MPGNIQLFRKATVRYKPGHVDGVKTKHSVMCATRCTRCRPVDWKMTGRNQLRTTKPWQVLTALFAFILFASACTSAADDESTSDTTAAESGGSDTTAAESGGDEGGGDEGDGEEEVTLSQGGSTLDTVKERGTLVCGSNDTLPGFGFADADGEVVGFDADFCRIVAAAILGDANAVDFVPLEAAQRFTALQSGEIDVLIRNTTWTATRDGSESGNFLTPTYYDGQGMMVSADSGITDFDGLADAAICVQSGTTTELNLASYMESLGVPFEPATFDSNDTLRPAFEAGQCEGWTSDASQLAAFKSSIEEAGGDELTIFETIISKEPLGPVVADGDTEWAQAVNWAVMAAIQAEEFGLDSSNIASYDGDNPEILRFVGKEAGFEPGLGLPADFAVQAVSQVGNYGELYEEHITPLGLSRGVNNLWTEGGLHYVPPYR